MKISSFHLWAPGMSEKEDWINGKAIEDSAESPTLTFLSPIKIRRLGQLERMTTLSVWKLGRNADALFFSSVWGSVGTQLKLNTMYAESGELTPALFSHSVFNSPVAEATILLSSHMPYSTIYPGKNDVIRTLINVSRSAIESGRRDSVIAIYAEEYMPLEYRSCIKEEDLMKPMCIAVKLEKGDGTKIPDCALYSPSSLSKYLVENEADKWVF